jgi:hypothetical protein
VTTRGGFAGIDVAAHDKGKMKLLTHDERKLLLLLLLCNKETKESLLLL